MKGEVHQCSMDDVVLMMSQGYLVAIELLGDIEELFASLPRTEEAGRLALRVEGCTTIHRTHGATTISRLGSGPTAT